jgi:hypothetical protein
VTNERTRILREAGREIFAPLGVRQIGSGRHWVNDHGWWIVNVEFQPSGFAKGTYLNVGAQWLWRPFPSFAFEYGDPIRVRFMTQKKPQDFAPFESKGQFDVDVRNLARVGAVEIMKLDETFRTVESSLRAWRRGRDHLAYHLAVASGLTNRPREARDYFRLARLKDPEHDWQRAANVLMEELNELVADQQAFRARISEIVHTEREVLKLEPALNLELPR